MASDLGYVQFVFEQIKDAGEITYKKMFGEYCFYCNGKVFGGVYDDRFLIKLTPAASAMAPGFKTELPYEGGKPMLLVEDLDDREFLRQLILRTCEALKK